MQKIILPVMEECPAQLHPQAVLLFAQGHSVPEASPGLVHLLCECLVWQPVNSTTIDPVLWQAQLRLLQPSLQRCAIFATSAASLLWLSGLVIYLQSAHALQ